MLYYLENGAVLYIVGAILFIGLFSKWIANRTYKSLLRQTERFKNVKNITLKQLRNQYESIHKSHREIHNVPVFIEKQLGQIKVWGMHLYRLENMALPAALLCFLFGTGSSLAAFLCHGTAELIVIQFAAGLLAGIILLMSECFWDIESKRSLLFVQIQDYLENTMDLQLQTATTVTEAPVRKAMQDDIFMKSRPEYTGRAEVEFRRTRKEEHKKEPEKKEASLTEEAQDRDRSIAFLRKSLEQIAAAREQKNSTMQSQAGRTLSPEDEQLMEEIINEYLRKN